MKNVEEMDGNELVEEFCRQKKKIRMSFEGETGVEGFSQLVEAMGYDGYGSPLTNFLADNPGCLEVMVEWIIEQMDDRKDPGEWKEKLHDAVDGQIDDDNEAELEQQLMDAGADYVGDNPQLSEQDLQNSCGDLADGVLEEAKEYGVGMDRDCAKDVVYEGMVQARKLQKEGKEGEDVHG